MSDDTVEQPLGGYQPQRRGLSLRTIGGMTLLAFAGGATLAGWLIWDGRVALPDQLFGVKPAVTVPAAPASPSPAATAATAALESGALDLFAQRVAALEQRLNSIDLQAAAAEGQTARAEALLVAFASRRAIERGSPLGLLEAQLKLRFGNSQPNAVATLIDSAAKPVTLDQLAAQLDALEPVLIKAPANEDGWTQLKRELSGLFVLRRADSPPPKPESRLDRARIMLRSGQLDAAVKEVQALPGGADARVWINAVQRYAMAQRALDLIETTALLTPSRPALPKAPPAANAAPDAGPVTTPDAPPSDSAV